MSFKFTMMFNFGGQGFSETWYYNGNVSFPVPQNSVFDQLMQLRGLLCGDFVSPQGWRLSDVANPRSTFIRLFSKVNTSGEAPDTPSNAWLAEVRGVNGVGRRQLWLRCVPDDWVKWSSADNRFVPVGNLVTAIQNYETALKTPPWAIRTAKTLAASTAKTRITSAGAGGGGGTILAADMTAVNRNGNLLVSGFRKPLGVLNGTYDVNSGFDSSPTSMTLIHKTASAADYATYVGGGWIRNVVYDYTNIAQVDLIQPRERKVGRAFFVPRGRRSVR